MVYWCRVPAPRRTPPDPSAIRSLSCLYFLFLCTFPFVARPFRVTVSVSVSLALVASSLRPFRVFMLASLGRSWCDVILSRESVSSAPPSCSSATINH